MTFVFAVVFGILALLLLVVCVVCYSVALKLYGAILTRTGVTASQAQVTLPDEAKAHDEHVKQLGEAMLARSHEYIEIKSHDGLKLRALYIPAEVPARRTVLFIHGYTCTGMREFAVFADFYRRLGYNILLPDDRAHGESEGEEIGFGYWDRLDTINWGKYIIDRLGEDSEVLLHGVSMGAATVMMAAGEKLPEQVIGVIADCGYTSAWDEFSYQFGKMYHMPSFPLLNFTSLVCKLKAGFFFSACSPIKAVGRASAPILFIHGGADDFVPTRMAYALKDACASPSELFIVKDAKHAASYITDPEGYEKAVIDWLEHIDKSEVE